MTPHTHETSPELPCHRCGYDLRAHPPDGACPECRASVAESRRIAAVPLRPAWRDSDPRWRRRILTGLWLLLLLPLMDFLQTFDFASRLTLPTLLPDQGARFTLADALLSWPGVYQPLVFCIGIALLFSKERARRRNKLDWTRRWGVLCAYVVLLLGAVQILFICALVLTGISACFQCMPPKYQPPLTQLFVDVSTTYLRYGPYPRPISVAVLVAFSSITILLACAPLFDALRSTGRKRPAAVLLAPLAAFALLHLAQTSPYFLAFGNAPMADFAHYSVYFWPELLAKYLAGAPPTGNLSTPILLAFLVEALKWCTLLAIAVWLTIAQLAARRKPHPADIRPAPAPAI